VKKLLLVAVLASIPLSVFAGDFGKLESRYLLKSRYMKKTIPVKEKKHFVSYRKQKEVQKNQRKQLLGIVGNYKIIAVNGKEKVVRKIK